MDDKDDVARHKANSEDGKDQEADFNIPAPLLGLERPYDRDIAEHDGGERHQEPEDSQGHVVVELEGRHGLAGAVHIVAGVDAQLPHVVALLHDGQGQHVQEDGGPDGGAGGHGVGALGEPLVGEGVDDSHVAADADACQQQDGAVHVAVEHGRGRPARGLPEHPVVPIEVVGYPEGQRDAEEQVRRGQVGVEDGGAHGADPEEQHPQNDGIRGHAQQNNAEVDSRYQLGAQRAGQVLQRGVAHLC